MVQASSFKRFVVPREGVNRIHDSPRVSVDSNCLPFSLSSTIRNRDKTEANAPVRHRRIPLTATVFQSIARNRERERDFQFKEKEEIIELPKPRNIVVEARYEPFSRELSD